MSSIERFQVEEDTSYQVQFSWVNNNGSPITLAEVSTLTLTLYATRDQSIVNTRNAQNVLNTNNVTFHATSGLLTWSVQPADVAFSNEALSKEVHRALFQLELSNGVRAKKEIDLVVRNLQFV